MFGGGIGAAPLGSTVVENNLDRITVVVALVFIFCTIGFGLLSTERRSLATVTAPRRSGGIGDAPG